MSKFENAFESFRNKEFHLRQDLEKEFIKQIREYKFDINNIEESIIGRLEIVSSYINDYGSKFIQSFIDTLKTFECPKLSSAEINTTVNELKTQLTKWSDINESGFTTYLKNLNIPYILDDVQKYEYYVRPREVVLNKLTTELSEYNHNPKSHFAKFKKGYYYTFVLSVLTGLIILIIQFGFFDKKDNKTESSTETKEQQNNPTPDTISKEKNDKELSGASESDTSTNKVDTLQQSSYKPVGQDVFEIFYGNSSLGFIQLPEELTGFELYEQIGKSVQPKDNRYFLEFNGWGKYSLNRDSLLNNIARYIIIANSRKMRLIISAFDNSASDPKLEWSGNTKILYGKTKNTLSPLAKTRIYHQGDKEIYPNRYINNEYVP